jgi:hypothetical protein
MCLELNRCLYQRIPDVDDGAMCVAQTILYDDTIATPY